MTSPLSHGTHKLVVSNEVCDYAFLGLEDTETEFTVVKDKIKPTGIVISSTQTKVTIKFSEEVEFTDIDNISTDSSAEIEGIELCCDDMTFTIYFCAESPFPSSGGKITIRNLTDLSGNNVDLELHVPPIV